MTPTEFSPSKGSFGDWLVTTRDTPEIRTKMHALGAKAYERVGHTLYLIGLPEPRGVIVNGLAVINGDFILGPALFDDIGSEVIGNCEIIDARGCTTTRVYGDAFCSRPIFFSETLATNRLHLAGLLVEGVDERAALSIIFSENSFSQQYNVRKTPVPGVFLLLAHERLEIGTRVVVAASDWHADYEPLTPGQYWDLIERGAEEIRSNVRAVVASGLELACAMTGGRDSRVNFAALVSIGAVDAVTFRTIPRDRDVEIATALVSKAGGRYANDPVTDIKVRSFEQCLAERRSHRYGAYHLIGSADFKTVLFDVGPRSLLIGGGLGELYRGFYQKHFSDGGPPTSCAPGSTHDMLFDYSKHMLGDWGDHFSYVVGNLLDTFSDLPGLTLSDKLDAHYLNFRNRFHFGQPLSSRPTEDHAFNPLMAPSLLRAARGLPNDVKNTGRVVFDVTKVLSESLAHLPYETPWPAALFSGPYHRRSKLEDKALTIVPKPEMIPTPDAIVVPKGEYVDARAMFKSSCLINIERLKKGALARAATPALEKRVHWMISKDRPSLPVWYSRLQALADYGDV